VALLEAEGDDVTEYEIQQWTARFIQAALTPLMLAISELQSRVDELQRSTKRPMYDPVDGGSEYNGPFKLNVVTTESDGEIICVLQVSGGYVIPNEQTVRYYNGYEDTIRQNAGSYLVVLRYERDVNPSVEIIKMEDVETLSKNSTNARWDTILGRLDVVDRDGQLYSSIAQWYYGNIYVPVVDALGLPIPSGEGVAVLGVKHETENRLVWKSSFPIVHR